MTDPLWPPQVDLINGVRASLRDKHRRIIAQSATGSGKTRVAAEIIHMAEKKGNRTLFLAPRRELVVQAHGRLTKHGIEAGVIMAGEPRNQWARHQVASLDTLYVRGVKKNADGETKILLPPAEIVIMDEAHLSLAPTRKEILASYPEAVLIGLTATPARGDGRGLGEIYDDLVLGWPIGKLMEGGYLVGSIEYFGPPEGAATVDLSGVKVQGGDYVVGGKSGLEEALDNGELIGSVVDNWMRIARDKHTVVFAAACKHSRHLAAEFVRRGIKAEHLDGETPMDERRAILRRVETKETQVLCNVFVASYGLDIPSLECCVLARPTKNITLYLQMIGRVLRAYPGKLVAFVIDHACAVEENGFVEDEVPWSLEADEKVKDRKKKAQEEMAAPKEITCRKCGCVFKRRRDCPKCGHAMVPTSEPIPTHAAELQNIERTLEKNNKNSTWEEKASFMGQLKTHARKMNMRDGWVSYKYKERYGVWPNDKRVKRAPPVPITDEVRDWIRSRQIAWAKSKEGATV